MPQKSDKEIAAEILIAAINNGLLTGQKPRVDGVDSIMETVGQAYQTILQKIQESSASQ